MTEHSIGIDISKSHLDVFHLETETAKRFENSAHGFRALRKWLAPLAVTRVVFEATGPYRRAFEKAFSGVFLCSRSILSRHAVSRKPAGHGSRRTR